MKDTIKDTQGVHPRKLKLTKQKVSRDTKDDLSSEDEEHFSTEEEKQDLRRQFKKTGSFPKVNFKTFPNISNTR